MSTSPRPRKGWIKAVVEVRGTTLAYYEVDAPDIAYAETMTIEQLRASGRYMHGREDIKVTRAQEIKQ